MPKTISQPELVCFQCVLEECIPEHKDCLWRLAGKVLSRKARIRRTRRAIENTKAQLARMETTLNKLRVDRKTYDRQRYLLRKSRGEI
jgi:hypothetical protein